MSGRSNRDRFAVIGIGCRFPGGANTPERFWKLLCDGTDAITEIPRDRFDLAELYDSDPSRPGKIYTRWGGFVDDVQTFDAEFFGISPREAGRVDPQQRLLLEVVWEALEDGGLPPDHLTGSNTGVFIGISTHDYYDLQVNPANRHLLDAHCGTGTALSIAANRISYVYDLRGPSLVVDTACSSSLTAVHLACRSLSGRECDLAIAGGVNVFLTPETAIGFCKAAMLSVDGRCKAFDAGADGFVRGEGAAVVVLKPIERALAEGDRIYAVVRGSAVNQDGRTVGITVPSTDAQETLIRKALRDAGAEASDVHYIEAHGTGTRVGDPIEAAGIGRALRHGRDPAHPCLIGSVKTNIGHLEAAAGIAGLIKTALALRHRTIPPSLHFTQANPAIPLDGLGLRVVTTLQPWPANGTRALAGVNSFGFGGANAHVVLEDAPPMDATGVSRHASGHILPLSARRVEALRQVASRHRDLLTADGCPPLADVCYSAAVRRSHHIHRVGLVADTREEMVEQIDGFLSRAAAESSASAGGARGKAPRLAFVFTGMGPQWWGMGRQLLEEEPVFRHTIEECDRRFRDVGTWPLLESLAAEETVSRVHEADLAVTTNFAIQMGLVALLRSWGIIPDALVGHSAGEIGAACAAGALRLEDALLVSFHRGRLQHRTRGMGTLLSASLSEAAARRIIEPLADRVSIAAINSPASVTLSGDRRTLEQIAAELTPQCFNRFVRVEVPYHGPPMDALRDELLESLASLAPSVPSVPLASTVSGTWATTALDPQYWFDNVRRPVRFADAIGRLIDDDYDLFLEIGPHPVLSVSVMECLSARGRAGTVLPTLRRKEAERHVMLRSLATLYGRGYRVNWSGVYPGGNLVPLPHYPWQGERHWFEAHGAAPPRPTGTDSGHPLLGYRLRSPRPSWESVLSQPALDYLDGHRIQASPVFPAAAYVEMALAAANEVAPDTAPVIEDLTFTKALFLTRRKETTLQFLIDAQGSRFEIHGGTGERDAGWTMHAVGKLKTQPRVSSDLAIDLAAIRDRCPATVPVADAYDTLEARGLSYRGVFRGIESLGRGDGEAIARIALPADIEADVYRVHPALLDSAFQALLAALRPEDRKASQDHRLFLPVSIKRVTLLRKPGASFWGHARLVHIDSDALEGDITILDRDGQVALIIEGLSCKALREGARGGAAAHEPTYQLVWEPKPLGATSIREGERVRTSVDVAARLEPLAARLADEMGWADRLRQAEPTLNGIVAHFIRAALIALGWDPRGAPPDEAGPLGEAVGVAPRHRRFFARLLEILRESRAEEVCDATAAGERARAEALCEDACAEQPTNRPAVDLLRRSGERLDAILRGELDPREVLFAPAALPAWGRFFVDLPWYAYYNTLVAEAVAAAIEEVPAGTRLRVLEIGAGTAGTTQSVLPRLTSRDAEYYFTDLSTLFLAQARSRFRDQPFVHVASLDLEADPIAQLGTEPFHVVLAANVVHATADLRTSLGHIRKLLAPGGLLVLLEGTRKMASLDLIFGITDGWWRFTDTVVRPVYPMMNPRSWRSLLAEVGFEGAQSVSEPHVEGDPLQAVILATRPERGSGADVSRSAVRDWLVFADATGVSERLTAALRSRGDRVAWVRPADGYRRADVETFEVAADSAEDTSRLVNDLAASGFGFDGLLHAWSLDAPGAETLTGSAAVEAQRVNCGSVVALLQGFARSGRSLPPLWLLTAGAQAIGAVDERPNVAQAPIWGIGRVLASEEPGVSCRLVDLDPRADDDEIRALLEEIDADDGGEEVALRGSERYVTRFRRARVHGAVQESQKQARAPEHCAFRLDIDAPGSLETLTLRETPRVRPGPGEILIRVRASGINFRDVMLALGMLPPMSIPGTAGRTVLGFECAGTVVECGAGVDAFQTGDAVMAIAIGAFGSLVITRAEMAAPKPEHLTFEEAATIPLAFVTAHYAFSRLAGLSRGERVLIHTATGGVGLAAVQLAKRVGAEIFATAGSPEKRAYLKARNIEHVMDSRSVAFADGVMAATSGEGVDVVLNSLAGEAIPKGLSILRPYGRFVELGKRDIHADAPIGLLPFDRNLSFSSVALDRMCLDRPAFVGSMLREIAALVADRALEPIPHQAFDLAEAEGALRLLAQARHIGKLVLTAHQPSYRVAPCAERAICRPDASYLISGGLGGFGLAVARRLVELGARHLVLMSRRHTPIPENQAALDALQKSPAEVVIFAGDVSREADVCRMLDEIRRTMPPLRGIVHAAMVLDDVLLQHMTPARLEGVLAPKIGGAWNLHKLTEDDALDFFVMFSSGMSQLGTKWQGNYAAANLFLDVLAPYRRSLGLPALTLNWGALGEVGYVSRHEEIAQHLQRQGMDALTLAEALGWLEDAIRLGFANLTVARMDWPRWSSVDPKTAIVKKTKRVAHFASAEETTAGDTAAESGALLPVLAAAPPADRQALLTAHLVGRVARVLGTSPTKLDVERPLTEMGVDSLMAVEIQTVVDRDLGVSLSLASLLEGVTVRQLTSMLLDQLDLDAAASEPGSAGVEKAATTARDNGGEAEARRATAARDPGKPPSEARVPDATEHTGTSALRFPAVEVDAQIPALPVAATAVANPLSPRASLPPSPSVVAPPPTVDYAAIDYGRWSPLQRIGQTVFRMLFRILAPVVVEGLENIPRSGPALLAVNHLSMLDLPLLVTVLPRRTICIATERLRRFPWLRKFLDVGDTIYVRRGEADQRALSQGLAVLRAGGLLGVAPEGTRSRTGGLTRGQSGIAYLAAEAQAPILPIAAYGQEQIVRNLKRLRRTRVHVRIGPLITPTPGEKTPAKLLRDTERVMTALAAMLPPGYRGVYADAVEEPGRSEGEAQSAKVAQAGEPTG